MSDGYPAHMECPFPDCSWRSTSWMENKGREEASSQWQAHKHQHTHFGPIFVRDEP